MSFRFQPEVCNSCHGLMEKSLSFNDATIFTVKENDYRIHFLYMSKDEAINFLGNVDLTEKSDTL